MKKIILLSAAALLTAFPVTNTIFQAPVGQAIQQQAPQAQQQLLALGASLNAYQSQQTLQLLGVGQINPNNTVYVDGPTIHRYLNDGSGPETIVYSSAVIQPMNPGYGVIVQVVTPQNITLVSPATYQNAAITAGAKNAHIKIAAASPVTGEGALAGVYALLERQGVQVSTKDVQVAQQEIKVVNEVSQSTSAQQNGLTDQQINKMIAEIKAEVIDLKQQTQAPVEQTTATEQTTQAEGQNQNNEQNAEQNNEVDNDTNINNETNVTGDNNVVVNDNTVDNSTEINNIVNNIVNQYNISDQTVIEELKIYAQNYSETESAKNIETKDQLQQSITDREPAQAWTTVLQGLYPVPVDQLLMAEKIDYSDTNIYAPIIQEIQTQLYQRIESGQSIDDLYSDTFIFEMSQAQLSNNNQHALNELRTIMYQYAANEDLNNQGNPAYVGVKDRWLAQIVNLNYVSPEYQELLRQIAMSTGLAPQVYNYQPIESDNSTVNFEINIDQSDNSVTQVMNVNYDLDNGEISDPNQGGGLFGLGGDKEITDQNYLSEEYNSNTEITREALPVNLAVEDIIQTQEVQESQADMYIPVEPEEGFEETFEESLVETTAMDPITETSEESESMESSLEETIQESEPVEESTLEESSMEESMVEDSTVEDSSMEETSEESSMEDTSVEESAETPREFPAPDAWGNVLSGLNAVPVDQLLSQEREDFSDPELFHPLMEKLNSELYQRMERNELIEDLYAHTFVFEASQDPAYISNEDAYALDHLRTIMYQYAANQDQELMASQDASQPYTDVKTRWLDGMVNYDNLEYTDGNLHEMIRQIMVATGRAPQVYTYVPVSQEGTVITFEIFYDNPMGHTSDMLIVEYDLATGSITDTSGGGLFGGGDLSNANYLADQYNVSVDMTRQAMNVDPNYVVPGLESTAEESQEEQTDDQMMQTVPGENLESEVGEIFESEPAMEEGLESVEEDQGF